MTSADTIREALALVNEINENASSIRSDWSDPRTECRAIWDACAKLKALIAQAETAHEADLEEAFRAGLDYVRASCTVTIVPTADAAVAAWRERRAAERKASDEHGGT